MYDIRQPAIENLSLAIVERINITSCEFDIKYEIHESTNINGGLFLQTTDGPRLIPSVAPDLHSFTQFTRRIAKARNDGRDGCGIKVKISCAIQGDPFGFPGGSQVQGDAFGLLEANYKPAIQSSRFSSPLEHQTHTAAPGYSAMPNVAENLPP
jgi:hypothetical protein